MKITEKSRRRAGWDDHAPPVRLLQVGGGNAGDRREVARDQGQTQGERKETIPAAKAVRIPTPAAGSLLM